MEENITKQEIIDDSKKSKEQLIEESIIRVINETKLAIDSSIVFAIISFIMSILSMIISIYDQVYIPPECSCEEGRYVGLSSFDISHPAFIFSGLTSLLGIMLIVTKRLLTIKRDKKIRKIINIYEA